VIPVDTSTSIDVLASVSLSGGARLWTGEGRLRQMAAAMDPAFEPGSPQTDG
jgi:hypothetical protein